MTDTITLPRAKAKELLRALRVFDAGAMIKAEQMLIDALAQQAEQGWQPASNPPTEAHGEVLVLMRDGTCEIAWATYWHGASTSFAGWTFRDPDTEDAAPTHWMPLPSPPKETTCKQKP